MVDACLDIVRSGDKDMFLSLLFAPEAAQQHLFALHAFAIEIERIPHLVSEPQIGEIRLQWWADTVTAIAAGIVQDHPIAKALAEAIAIHKLPLAPLSALIEARRFNLYADRMVTLNDLEGYCGETRAALFQLSCTILDCDASPQAAEASGYAGVAFELARVMVLPGSETYMPKGLSRADVINLAERRLGEARAIIARLPKSLIPAFLPLAIVPDYVAAARLEKSHVPQWKRQLNIWRAARRGKI